MDSKSTEARKLLQSTESLNESFKSLSESFPLINYTNKETLNRCCNKWRFGKNYLRELKGRSLTIPVILLLIYMAPISMCTVVLYNIANGMIQPACYQTTESNPTEYSFVTITENALYLLIPISGWISDTKIGRGNGVYLSLWVGWIGTLLQTLSSCFQYSSCGTVAAIGQYGLSVVALVLLLISMSFMYANGLAYGMDQLMVSTSVKVRAYIYWTVWVIFSAGNISSYTSFISDEKDYRTGALCVVFIAFCLFSLSLCLHFHLNHLFEHIPIPNPYKTVRQVLKYSIENKYPRNRSAFSYWGNETPNRINIAKDKYGGPFTHEEVENVKTFFRILAVLAAFTPFLISSDPFINGITSFVEQFSNANTALNGNASFGLWFIGDNIVLIIVPLLELVILPLFPKLEYFLINPLKGLGVAIICIILSISSVFLSDLLGRIINKQYDIPCFTDTSITDPSVISISFWILLLPSILAGIADAMSFLCIFEFICSQAPFGMHGMLIGIFWLLRAICINIGSIVTITFRYHDFTGPNILKTSCTSWFTLFLGTIAIIGLVVYIITARWYIKRVRNDDLSLRATIEERFEQQLMKEESFTIKKNDTDEDIRVVLIENNNS